jgi:hypothetical protein
MRFPLRSSLTGGPAAAAALLLLPAAVLASDEPVNARPLTATVQEVESLLAPAAPPIAAPDDRELDPTSLRPTPVAPDAAQRGGVRTDASDGLPPGSLTALERAKLDEARAAVEASRAAGTLFMTELPDATLPATREELAAMKMQQLAARPSAAPAPDPIAGVGEDLKPVQSNGPAQLTPAEEAKLRGETLPEQSVPSSVDAPPPGESPAGDGAPTSADPTIVQKETRHE